MRTKKGTVTSKKMNKTLVVTINRYKTHSKYKKKYRVSKKYYVDNPENKYEVGDKITIYETKPLSKLKRWTVVASKASNLKKKEAEALEPTPTT